MKTVLENEFVKMNFDDSRSFMETIWTTTPLMGQEQFRELLKSNYLVQLEKYRPNKLLIDSRNAEYVVAPENQDWINVNIYPQTVEAGVRKIAFLESKDFIVKISLEQVAEDSEENEEIKLKVQQRFFGDHQESLDWLFE